MADNHQIKTAFVSSNSITQGEQVGILWTDLLKRNVLIHFAHRTFQWSNEARGKASVHCVIIGFALRDTVDKRIFDYENVKGEPHEIRASNINPYLVDAPTVLIKKRSSPICDVPEINKGSEATDFGHLVFTPDERAALLKVEPQAEKWLKRYIGGDEYINNIERYCLWLKGISPSELRAMPKVMERIEKVRQARLASDKARTKEWASSPTLFTENRQPECSYLAVPKVSSERRAFIPMGFVSKDWIASGSTQVVPRATVFHFGILTSTMHMAWMRSVCGRLESRYQYSNSIVYNNFPWPKNPSDKQKQAIEAAAQAVLDARVQFPDSSLADLYDPLTTPPVLLKAHQTLDKAVDAAYGKTNFKTEAERVAFLFELYQKYTTLFPIVKTKKGNKAKNSSTQVH